LKNLVKRKTHTNSVNYKETKNRSVLFLRLAIIFFFIGMGLCIFFYNKTLIHFYSFSKFYIAFSVIGFLIPLRLYAKWFQFIKYEMILFNIIGIGPIFTGLFLLINFLFTTSPNTHSYKIEKIYTTKNQDSGVILANNTFSHEPKIVAIQNYDQYNIQLHHHLKITLAKGCFGYEVIKNRAFVK